MDEVFIARAGFQVFSVQLKRNLSIWAAALNFQALALGNPSSHDRGWRGDDWQLSFDKRDILR